MATIITRIDPYTNESFNFIQVTTWYDGSNMTDTYVDGIVYIKHSDGNYYVDCGFLANKTIAVERFGAKGDGVTDDKSKIQDSVSLLEKFSIKQPFGNSAPFGAAGYIPTLLLKSSKGYVVSDTVTISKSMNVDMEGSFIYFTGGNKTCFLLDSFQYCNININGINKSKLGQGYIADWTMTDNQFVVCKNLQYCNIKSERMVGFTRGLICLADNGGFAGNKIHLGYMNNMYESFIIKSVNNGWPNQNQVFGGMFGTWGGCQDVTGISRHRSFVKIESDGTYGANSWSFYGQGFEGMLRNGDNTVILDTVVLDASDYGIISFKLSDIRIEGVANLPNPTFILGNNTKNTIVDTNMFCDNSLGKYADGREILYDDIFKSKHTYRKYKKFIEIDIYNVKNDDSIRVSNNYSVKGKYEIFGSGGLFFNIFTDFGVGSLLSKVGYLIKVYPNMILKFNSDERSVLFPLTVNFKPTNNQTDVHGLILNKNYSFYIGGGSNQPCFIVDNNSTSLKIDKYIQITDELNFPYFFITPFKNKIEIYYDTDLSAPELTGTRPLKKGLENHYILQDSINSNISTVEIGMRLYDIIHNVEYTITKAGTTGTNTGGHQFNGGIGATILTDSAQKVNIILKTGQYCKVGNNKFRIIDINVTNNSISIDTPLTETVNDASLVFVSPIYISSQW